MTRICFIGFGEAARSWAASMAGHGVRDMHAYDIVLHTHHADELRGAAAERGVMLHNSNADAVRSADFVICAVTASQCLEAAVSTAAAIGKGQTYLDINSVSPDRKRMAAAEIAARGAAYVDVAVMAPVHPAGHRTPVLLAGALASSDIAMLDALAFNYEIVGDEPGAAAGIKMIRSLFVKGLEALTAQTLAAAAKTGCIDRVLTSLAASYPGLGWEAFAPYQFERMARHGIRRAAEMRECSATFAELGFEAGSRMAAAVADLQELIGAGRIDAATQRDARLWAGQAMRFLEATDDR